MHVVADQDLASHPAGTAAPRTPAKLGIYFTLFFLSGFPALLYQIVWQRALFTLYGVNIESVTMIVTVFMLGLGLGSLLGGRLSSQPVIRPLLTFGLIEISIGVFGSASLWIFHRVASVTAGHSTLVTGLIAFALLLIPTLLMGSTLPLLVEHVVKTTGNVGESVGSLYCVNTFGSALACFAAAIFLMHMLGETGSVRLACCFNLAVGTTAILISLRRTSTAKQTTPKLQEPSTETVPHQTIPLALGVILAGITGFIALAYEIIWYRLYSFGTAGKASCFPLLLAFYLLGIAYGSLVVHDLSRKKLRNDTPRTLWIASIVVLLGSIAAFLLGPTLARSINHLPFGFTYVFIFIAATLLGSAFPLLAHAAIDPASGAGKSISYLYLSNIIGSTLGSFLIGFVILDHWSTQATSTLLLALGFATWVALVVLSNSRRKKSVILAGCAACIILALSSGRIYSDLYERLQAKSDYHPGLQFADIVENRSGVIMVSPDDIVYGGGAYDGRFSTDLVDDTNGIFRAFAVAGLHPKPANVLVIGLSSGSWVQVVANNPQVKDITVVEINPGYLPLIAKHKEVESILANPKVHIVIDDGRRWLVSHPDRKFDFILMNTTHAWRANVSNLLSQEFLTLIRSHLAPGGIEFYNTTLSDEAMKTGSSVFPYSLRFGSFLAVGDSPFTLDRNRWKQALANYQIDGHPVFDLSNPHHQTRLEEVLHMADESSATGPYETRESMLKRLERVGLITDDNMGNEWN